MPRLQTRQRLSRRAFIFDADGVLTDSRHEHVPKSLLEHLTRLLIEENPVAINTGRPLPWTIEKILRPLTQYLPSRESLSSFAISAEKGAVLFYLRGTDAQIEVSPELKVPDDVQSEVRAYCAEGKFLAHLPKELRSDESSFRELFIYDDQKVAMASIYIPDKLPARVIETGITLLRANLGIQVSADLQRIIDNFNLSADFVIAGSTIAIDVEHRAGGKGLGTKKICSALNLSPTRTDSVLTFGDSAADYEMPEALERMGFKQVCHYHVGPPSPLKAKGQSEYQFTPGRFCFDTEKILTKIRDSYGNC